MKIFKNSIISLFLIILFCVAGFAQYKGSVIFPEQIRQLIEEKYSRDIVSETKDIIYKYYGRKNFDKPEWIRIKNFLTWIEDNKDNLNKKFATKKIDKLSKEKQKFYIGAFLGAQYITHQMIDKDFDLSISFSDGCYTSDHGFICIFANDFIDAINGAMHEAVHMFPYVQNPNAKGKLLGIEHNLSEEITIFAQFKYGLPMKPEGNDIRIGTRATFMFADNNFIKEHIEEISREYANIAYSATKYYVYNKTNIFNYRWQYTCLVDSLLRSLVLYKIQQKVHFDKPKLSEYEREFLLNSVYRNTLDEIMPIFRPDSYDPWCTGYECYPYLYGKTLDESYEYIYKLFDENLEEIITIFYKNLKKYADKNIPPIPKGYI